LSDWKSQLKIFANTSDVHQEVAKPSCSLLCAKRLLHKILHDKRKSFFAY